MKTYYKVNLEHREHALKGWNWGKAEFSKQELYFNVANKPAFEIPFSEVSNSNLAGKNEVAVEFATADGGTAATNGEGNKKKKKSSQGLDQLVEMRFYVPGTVKKGEGDEGSDVDGEAGEEMSAANLFYDTLKEKADIGEVAGDTYATFLDILFLTPRYNPSLPLLRLLVMLTSLSEVVTISTCTRTLSVFVAEHTITRFNTTMSSNSSNYLNLMMFIR